jgi:hypothetical protein
MAEQSTTGAQLSSVDEIRACVEIMVKYDVTELTIGSVHIKRPAKEAPKQTFENMLDQVTKMSPDKQDATLMLGRLGGDRP